MPIEMDGDDGPCPRGHGPSGRLHVERIRLGLDVHEDRGGPDHEGRGRRRHEREGGREHLVTRAHAQRGQRQAQRVGAGGHAQRVARAGQRGQVVLQRRALGSQDEAGRAEDSVRRGQQVVAQRGVLAGQVQERDHREVPPPPPGVLTPPSRVPVVMGAPTPSKLSAKRSSSSLLLRETYSTVKAQHWNLRSSPNRFSTKTSARRSQLVSARTVAQRVASALSVPCRKCTSLVRSKRVPTDATTGFTSTDRSVVPVSNALAYTS